MPDSKITALTALTAADPANDMFPIVDVSDTSMAASGTTKRISINNLLAAGGTATLASATITGDLTVDTSTLKVNSSANQVGVGITTFTGTQSLQVLTGLRVSDANPESLNCLNLAVTSTTSTIETRYGTPLIFGTNATECYRISSTGVATWSNVGGVAGTAMTLNSTGLGVGVSPAAKIHIANASMLIDTLSTQNKPSLLLGSAGPNFGQIQNDGTGLWSLGYGATASALGTPVLSWNSSGNVGIGVTPSYKLDVRGSDNSVIAQFGGTNRQVRLSTSAISAVDNASFNFIHTSGSGRFTFQNNSGTQTMLTIDDNGNNIMRMPLIPPTLGVNLEGTFNLTSNTNLRISVRGTDGVTRTADITLA